jgi:AcrR family transcriptional regulator
MSERAQTLTDAVVAIIAESGFEALSVRTVAARAGMSIGAVQHHFPTKSQMLAAAMREVAGQEGERFERAAAAGDVTSRREALLDVLVPRDARDLTARVWLQFAARAVVDPELSTIYAGMWGGLRSGLAQGLQRQGHDPDEAKILATETLALCDGLAVAVLAEGGALRPEQARAIAEWHLERILSREP